MKTGLFHPQIGRRLSFLLLCLTVLLGAAAPAALAGGDDILKKIRTCTWCLKTVSFSYFTEGVAMVCQDKANPGRTLPGMASKD